MVRPYLLTADPGRDATDKNSKQDSDKAVDQAVLA
jgi:hypothetical protein